MAKPTTFQFTRDGFNKLKEEYDVLIKVKRPTTVTRLAKARAMGDLSENSEYTAAKEEIAFVEGRIKEVEELLKNAVVIEPTSSTGIDIGTQVTVEKNGALETFFIVGEFEADPMEKKLSSTSPIGKALLGKNLGDMVEVKVPVGTLKYVIKEIKKS
jgi:transcription elongation factor GreA